MMDDLPNWLTIPLAILCVLIGSIVVASVRGFFK